ncbi:DUF4129 domain-containing protein [Thermogemmatispora sp.]|uniref:DUF4129 domain-containing protein n=1 Tax=Thermogemmatispora sp. TaxID=1968838 RepID=UPI001DC9190D|nr:DUF4129 domain-containing protein [Thermogemmatispora sp.]MBX5451968.1 DUF4129 domain-containing protein [Thermogemmatispora sp.]
MSQEDPVSRQGRLPDDLLARIALTERRRRARLSQSTTYLPDIRTSGERLVAYLCLTLEVSALAAWLQLFAERHLFESTRPLAPLWALFPLGAAMLWLTRLFELRQVRSAPPLDEFDRPGSPLPGRGLIVGLLVASTLYLCWLNSYAAASPLYQPTWLLALGSDLLALRPAAYRSAAILCCVILLSWRGARWARQEPMPATVRRTVSVNGLLFLLAILVLLGAEGKTGQTLISVSTQIFFLLILLFIYCALLAQTLAQASAERRLHPLGLEGSITEQERTILLLFLGLGLVIGLLGLAVAILAGASLFETLRRALALLSIPYDWLVRGLAQIIVWLLTPLVWLLQAWHFQSRGLVIHPPRGPGQPALKGAGESASLPPDLLLISRILMLLAILLIALGGLRLVSKALRQRRVRLYRRQEFEESHESLWSGALFWQQLQQLLRTLMSRLGGLPQRWYQGATRLARRTMTAARQQQRGSSLLSMRAIYRALLDEARQQGYPRRKSETALEYRWRLERATPLADPRLGPLTGAYLAARYGGHEPDATQLSRLRAAWQELQKHWRRP